MDNHQTSLRTTPKTIRGERRVHMILDATEQLIAKIGYDAVTTNAIAERAQTSIGSLYQFFPNKESLVQALADRYGARLKALLDTTVEQASAGAGFIDQLDLLVDNIVTFNVQNVAFETIFLFASGSLPSVVSCDAIVTEIMGRVLDLFALWGPGVSVEKQELYAEVCMRTMQALLPGTHVEMETRPQMVSELKRMLGSYLEPVFGAGE